MEVSCRWRAKSRPNPFPRRLKKLIRRAAELAGLPVGEDWQCQVLVLDDPEMAQANAECLGHEGTTDVITFSYLDEPEGLFPGDVALELLIGAEVAAREGAARADSSFERELILYLAHGCLHAAGEDDLAPGPRRRMRRRERELLAVLAPEFLNE